MSDETLTNIAAEVAALKDRLAFYVSNGRTDTPAANALRGRIVLLEEHAQLHTDTVAADQAQFNARVKARSEGAGRWCASVGNETTMAQTYPKKHL